MHPIVFERVLGLVLAGGWQVVQGTDGLDVLLCGTSDGFAEETMADTLRRELVAQGTAVPPVRVRRAAALSRGASSKAPLIRSNRVGNLQNHFEKLV